MFDRFTSFLVSVSKHSHYLGAIVFLPILTFIVSVNVFFRYALNNPLAWGGEMSGLLLFLILFLSLAYAWDLNKHIRMEIVYVRLKGRMRRVADIASGIAGIIFFGILGIQAILNVPYMIKTHEVGEETGIPFWPFNVIVAIVSVVFVYKLFIYMIATPKESKITEREIEGVKIKREIE